MRVLLSGSVVGFGHGRRLGQTATDKSPSLSGRPYIKTRADQFGALSHDGQAHSAILGDGIGNPDAVVLHRQGRTPMVGQS
jgi:hypothetical protein